MRIDRNTNIVHLDNDLEKNLEIEEKRTNQFLLMAVTFISIGIAGIYAILKLVEWLVS